MTSLTQFMMGLSLMMEKISSSHIMMEKMENNKLIQLIMGLNLMMEKGFG